MLLDMSVTQQDDEYEEGEIVDDEDDVIIVSESIQVPVKSVEKKTIQINNVPAKVECKRIRFQVNAQSRFRNNGVINFEQKCESLVHLDNARRVSRDRFARRLNSREDRKSRFQSISRPDEKSTPAKSSNLRFSGKDSNHNEDTSYDRRLKDFENRQMKHRKDPLKTDEREDRLKGSQRKCNRSVRNNKRKSVSLVKVEETNTSLLKRLVGSGTVGIKNLRDLENSSKTSISSTSPSKDLENSDQPSISIASPSKDVENSNRTTISISSPSTDVESVTESDSSVKFVEIDSKQPKQPDEDDELNLLRIEALKTAMLRKHSDRIKRGVIPKKTKSRHTCDQECQHGGCKKSLEILGDGNTEAQNAEVISSLGEVVIYPEKDVKDSTQKSNLKRSVDHVSVTESEPKRVPLTNDLEVLKSDDSLDELALLRSLALQSVQDRSKENSKKLENDVPSKSVGNSEKGKEISSGKVALPSSDGNVTDNIVDEVDKKISIKPDPEDWEEVDEDILRAQLLQTLSGSLPESSKSSELYPDGVSLKTDLPFIKRISKSKGSSVTSAENDEELDKLSRIWSEKMVPSLVISLGSDSDSDTDHVGKSVDKFLNEARAMAESSDVKKSKESNKENSNTFVEPLPITKPVLPTGSKKPTVSRPKSSSSTVQVNPSQIKTAQVKPTQIKPAQVKPTQVKPALSLKLKSSATPQPQPTPAARPRIAARRKSLVLKLSRTTSVLKQSKSPLKPGVKRRIQVVKSGVALAKKLSTPVTVAFLPKDKREEYLRLKRELALKQKKQDFLKGKADGASASGDNQSEAGKKIVTKAEESYGKVPDLRSALAKSLVEAELEVLICRAREVEEARSRYNTGAHLVARAKRELAAAEALHLAHAQQLVDSGDRCKAHMNSCRIAFDKWTSSKNVPEAEKEALSDKFEELSRRTAQALQSLNIVKYRVDVCGWDPDAILCPHELAGACHNPACSFLHLDRPS